MFLELFNKLLKEKIMKIKIIIAMVLSLIIITASAVPVGHVDKKGGGGDDYLATYQGVAMHPTTTYINGQPHSVLISVTVSYATNAICSYYLNLYASNGGYIVTPCFKLAD